MIDRFVIVGSRCYDRLKRWKAQTGETRNATMHVEMTYVSEKGGLECRNRTDP